MLQTATALADIEHELVATNGIRLHVAKAGPRKGPLVLLLHGFPEFWYAWRRQMTSLAALGYRVWAPDQRGYNLSDKPRGRSAYRLDLLAADVLGVMDAAGCRRASLVGHDWGGIVTWRLATRVPERVESAAVLNAPHPSVFLRRLLADPGQMLRSLYAAFFQIPGLPEWWLRRRNWESLQRSMIRSSQPGTFEEADFARYRESWRQPGAMTAMLHWYRAATWSITRFPIEPIAVPLLLLWGERDAFLSTRLAELSVQRCESGRLVRLPQATHWLHHEEADQVSGLLAEHLQNGVPDVALKGTGRDL